MPLKAAPSPSTTRCVSRPVPRPLTQQVRIRVRFSDRSQVEKTFPHSATIDDVYAFVDTAIDPAAGAGDYVLFQTPPKRDFVRAHPDLRATTLVQLGFAPAAMLNIRWSDARRNGMWRPADHLPLNRYSHRRAGTAKARAAFACTRSARRAVVHRDPGAVCAHGELGRRKRCAREAQVPQGA